MQFTWNNDTIRWYINSNDYAGFYKNIARDIAPSLKGYQSLADLGCGLGLFGFEVHSLFDRIECIDENEIALNSIKARADSLNIGNIVTRKADCFHIDGAWDVIYMSFFGSRELDRFLPFCKKLFLVVGMNGAPEMFPMKTRYMKNTVPATIEYLESKRIPYTLKYRKYEFGQPLTSMEDARCCVRQYVPGISEDELEEHLRKRLKETDGEVYPLYMPRLKSIGIFELDGTLSS